MLNNHASCCIYTDISSQRKNSKNKYVPSRRKGSVQETRNKFLQHENSKLSLQKEEEEEEEPIPEWKRKLLVSALLKRKDMLQNRDTTSSASY